MNILGVQLEMFFSVILIIMVIVACFLMAFIDTEVTVAAYSIIDVAEFAVCFDAYDESFGFTLLTLRSTEF